MPRVDHQAESDCECIQPQLDRGRWAYGLGAYQRDGDPGAVVAAEILGGVGGGVE